MDVFSPFVPVSASEAKPGSIVILNWHRVQKTIAFVVSLPEGEHPSFLLLKPGHPGTGAIGVVSPNGASDADVLVPAGAHAVISGNPQDLGGDANLNVPIGSLYLTDDGRYAVMTQVERTMLGFDLETGEALQPQWKRLWFPRWSIVVPGHDGKLLTLCTIDATKPAEALK